MIIPFKSGNEGSGIIALFNEKFQVIAVGAFQTLTNVHPGFFQQEIEQGRFDGSILIKSSDLEIRFVLKDSKLISKDSKILFSGRGEACNYITQPGGAYDCAGARIEGMNWFDKALCYASFVGCFAQQVISCWISGCAIQ